MLAFQSVPNQHSMATQYLDDPAIHQSIDSNSQPFRILTTYMFDSVILQTFPSQDHTAPDILLRLFLPSEAVRGLFSYDKFHFFQLNTHNQTALDRTLVTSCHSYCDLRAVGQLEPWNIPDLLGVLTPILDPVKVSHCPFVAVLSCVCRARKRYEGRAMGT
jgi:hypothetical protein